MWTRRQAAVVAFLALFAVTTSMAVASTYTVTNTGDSGVGSLRQAILDANANPGDDTIVFAIVGSGVQTIVPASALPPITDSVTIDGYTQPGASANTNAPDQGTNAVILIEIDGTNTSNALGSAVLKISGTSGGTIRGLAINRGPMDGILIDGSSNVKVEGCFTGTNPAGSLPLNNVNTDISLVDTTDATIGGSTSAARNLISGTVGAGVYISGGSGHVVAGNLIGTDASGAVGLSLNHDGIELVMSASEVRIGGTSAGERNVISGNQNGLVLQNPVSDVLIEGNYVGTDVTGEFLVRNALAGISIEGSNTIGGSAAGAGNVISGNYNGIVVTNAGPVVQGNWIGTAADAVSPMGNVNRGVLVFGVNDVVIGGVGAGEANTIAFNGARGVSVYSITNGTTSGVTIRGNAIFGNGVLGIDLNEDGVSPDDFGDADPGVNGTQNYPIIGLVSPGAVSTNIQATLDSTSSTTFDIDLYAGMCLDRPQAFLQGQQYLGSTQVTTDASGHGTLSVDVPFVLAPGQPVTATATAPDGSTSEFSQRIVLTSTPPSGPPAGGASMSISGMLFESGLTVTVGGVPATNVVLLDAGDITANAPALAAGTLNDVVVTNPSGLTGTLRNAYLADFLDVPPTQQFYVDVAILAENAITAGIGGGNYGVDMPVLRQQIAVFVEKAKHGLCFTPPPCQGIFADVPCASPYATWIEALFADFITGGCGGGNFCPTTPVRRDQMAPILLRAEHGSAYTPPSCTGVFVDVPCPGPFTDYIEQLKTENVTSGCGGGNYCPSANNTRGQMAVFITKTFSLQ